MDGMGLTQKEMRNPTRVMKMFDILIGMDYMCVHTYEILSIHFHICTVYLLEKIVLRSKLKNNH